MITNVSTTMKINANIQKNPMTAKQACWLTNAIKDYAIALDITTIDTCGLASEHITRIMNQINKGAIKKIPSTHLVTPITWYVIIGERVQGVLADNAPTYNNVAIKSFTGSELEMKAKVNAKYPHSRISYTKDLEVAKKSAKEYVSMINTAIVNPMFEVACDVSSNASTSTTTELTMDAFEALSIEELRTLAKDMGVDLGRSRARNTIIARILA